LGLLVKTAQRIEDEAKNLGPRSHAALNNTRTKMTWRLRRADTFASRADIDLRRTLDLAEARARVKVAQALGRTVVELERIRREIVQRP